MRLGFGIMMLLAASSYAVDYHVALSGDDGADGLTWTSALRTVNAAVAKAHDTDTIVLSNGTFYIGATIVVTNSITVTSVAGAGQTTVSASNVSGRRVFSVAAAGATIDGLTITGGTTNGNGGGIYLADGTVRNCIVTNNSAYYGSGVYMIGGHVTNCVLTKNVTLSGGGAAGRGAGAYMTGGLLVDCRVSSNTSGRAGAGICMTGGGVDRCRVSQNAAGHHGGGIAIEGAGRVMNCVVFGNRSGSFVYGGGGIYVGHAGASVLNCTVVDNQAPSDMDGGGVYRLAGGVTNTIVYFNTLSSGQDDNINTNGSETYVRGCCSPDLIHDPGGSGNIVTDPSFADRPNGDFALGVGSPCIDAGTNIAAVVTDYGGTARPADGDGDGAARHDMGALESPAFGTGPLDVDFLADIHEAPLSLEAVFTARVAGGDTNNLYYWWDLDGTTREGYAIASVTNLYATPGFRTVMLTASNEAGEVASVTRTDFIKVYASTTYVATNGANLAPYTNWGTAASSIQDAIGLVMTGGTVLIGAGTYFISNQVMVTRGVTVQGVGGRAATILERAGGATTRILSLANPAAVVEGVTLTKGIAATSDDVGGGVLLTAGLLRDSTITAGSAVYGAGVYMLGGVVSNCILLANNTKGGSGGSGQGGGIYMGAGTATHCTIVSNTSLRLGAAVRMFGPATLRNSVILGSTAGASGVLNGAVHVTAAGMVENCLIAGNTNVSTSGPGGLFVNSSGARIRNCTITGNAAPDVGGIMLLAGSATNLIVWNNRGGSGPNDISGTNSVGFSCSPDLAHEPAGKGNTTNNPRFIDPGSGYGLAHAVGDYHLAIDSPCIDSGLAMPDLHGGVDLGGTRRLSGGQIDMGAYEAAYGRSMILIVR